MDSPRNGSFVRGLAGAAITGGVIGVALSRTYIWANTASGKQCTGATGVCVGNAPLVGLGIGIAIVLAGCYGGFAIAGIRPLWIYVPAGVVLTIGVILIVRAPIAQTAPFAAIMAGFFGALGAVVTASTG